LSWLAPRPRHPHEGSAAVVPQDWVAGAKKNGRRRQTSHLRPGRSVRFQRPAPTIAGQSQHIKNVTRTVTAVKLPAARESVPHRFCTRVAGGLAEAQTTNLRANRRIEPKSRGVVATFLLRWSLRTASLPD
jgi:hypothetical protein